MVCSEWSTVGKPTRVFAQELGLLFCPRFYYDYIRNNISEYDIYSNMNIHIINILWVTTQTQLLKKKSLAGEWPKLFRKINFEKTTNKRFV